MKKIDSVFAVTALLISVNGFAQEQAKKEKKKAKTEKSCSSEEKKSCGTGEKKGGCCASKR